MYRKRELEWTIALLILIILAIVSYSFYFASSILNIEIILIVLAVLSVFLLPDMLLTWLLIFSSVLATIFLVAGVVYTNKSMFSTIDYLSAYFKHITTSQCSPTNLSFYCQGSY